MGLTQTGVQDLGGPSRAWLNSIQRFDGPPSTRHAPYLRKLDAVLRWPEGTSWDLVDRDRSDWSTQHLDDEQRELVNYKDEVSAFVYLIDRRLRALPEDDLRPAMLDVARRLGLPVLDE